MATFGITAATNTLVLDGQQRAQTAFTVSNLSGRPLRGRARLVAQQPDAQSWLTLDGEAERDFGIGETQQYAVRLAAPPKAAAGQYTFRLDEANVANPDDDYTQGPVVTFQVAPSARRSFPWWIVAVIAGVLLIAVLAAGGYLYMSDNDARRAALAKAAEATQTAAAAATQTAAAAATQTAVAGATQTALAGDASAAATATALARAATDATATALAIPQATADAQAAAPLADLYFASPGGAYPATLLRLSSGTIVTLYTRPANSVTSLAAAPDGSIYFLDGNRFEINRYQGGVETQVYLHTTYVRTVRLDSHGNVYFSEATGGGGNGVIYRLDTASSTATPFFTVDLAQVDGYWAGDFAFDKQDNLWLASGNRVPSMLYQVTGGTLQKVFTNPSGPLEGLCFETGGSLLFTDGKSALYRLTVPLYRQQALYTFPAGETVSDVVLAIP
jgi:hypothetical protein